MFDVEHIFLTDPNDPKIREVTARMSRFVCNLQTKSECFNEAAYIVETDVPVTFTRYTPDKVTSKKNVYLITEQEKSGSRIFFCPGVIGLIMFLKTGKTIDEGNVKSIQSSFMEYFINQIKGAYADGNDILINGKKIMGITVIHNISNGTLMIRFILTCKAERLKLLVSKDDFVGRKYKDITGVCDETGISESEARGMVKSFITKALLEVR